MYDSEQSLQITVSESSWFSVDFDAMIVGVYGIQTDIQKRSSQVILWDSQINSVAVHAELPRTHSVVIPPATIIVATRGKHVIAKLVINRSIVNVNVEHVTNDKNGDDKRPSVR